MVDFGILVVCTGNIARSPMAQRLLQTHLRGTPGLRVSSAGTWGHTGAPMERHAATALAEVGVDEDGFRAREVTPELVRAASLVLTATREHRARVLGHEPTALRRTFTLRELARLIDHVDVRWGPESDVAERGDALVAAAAAARGSVRVPPAADDIADPYGAPLDVYRRCRDEIDTAVRRIADALRGA